MFNNYKNGDDLTIMNTLYISPTYSKNKNERTDGCLYIVAKDNKTGKKILERIENPMYYFYIAKDNLDINEIYKHRDELDMVETPYKDLLKTIAELTDNLDFFYDNIKSGNSRANNSLFMHPRIFWADAALGDKYRFLFSNIFENKIIKPTKAFFDIEVDGMYQKGDFPELGEVPVNAVTLINQENKTVYTLLLRSSGNDQIALFEEEAHHKELYTELKKFVIDKVGGIEKAESFGVDKLNFKFMFYDEKEEINLIHDLFSLINHLQPDFAVAWNIAFDLPYLIKRIINIGYNPSDIICHPDFKDKKVHYYIDERAAELAERGDKAEISSYTVYLDQMIQFASIRKGQKQYPNYKLDTIGEEIAGVKKLDYSHITNDIKQLPYKDYKTFVFYNIMDTIVQFCIEEKTKDMEYILAKAIQNDTRYSKIHRQTKYLVNRVAKEFYKKGYIIGDNANAGNSKPDVKFDGAFVGDPLLVSDIPKLRINGIPVDIYNNLDDYDYKRLYPSIEQEFNMAPNTQIGKIIFEDKMVHSKEGHIISHKFSFNRSREFAEDFQSHDWIEFASRWLHLASYDELLEDINEYCKTQETIIPPRYDENGYINTVYRLSGPIVPIERDQDEPVIVRRRNDKMPIIKENK